MDHKLSTIYKILFDSQSSETVDPRIITTQLLNCNVSETDPQSTLLWLSILRKLLTVEEPRSVGATSDLNPNTAMDVILNNLLQEDSFIPLVITYVSYGNHLVCYLASKVLSLAILASQRIKEEWLRGIIHHITYTNHEPIYCIDVLKQLLKLVRKKQHSAIESGSKIILYSFVLSDWKGCFSIFSSKLKETRSSKWPELNFIEFLSWSHEILRHSSSNVTSQNEATLLVLDCSSMITDNLVELTTSVSKTCMSPVSLKELLKVYCKVAENSKSLVMSEICVVKNQLESCLPLLFMSNVFVGIVNSALQQMRENYFDFISSHVENVNRLILRKAISFLLKYGDLLEDKNILHYEKCLSTFFHDQCGLELSRYASSMHLVRKNLFQLLNEQDDDILDVLLSSYNMWRKRTLWIECPTLHFCFSATHLHFTIMNFLFSISYDHSFLLDFIVSPETSNFYTFLVKYLEVCIEDWRDLHMACQEMDSCQSSQKFLTDEELSSNRSGSEASISALLKDSSFEEVYSETTLDRVMDCFIKLKYALIRLSASQLLPNSVDALISVLSKVEDLYENMVL